MVHQCLYGGIHERQDSFFLLKSVSAHLFLIRNNLEKLLKSLNGGEAFFEYSLLTQCTINSLMFRCESCPDFVRLVVCFLESVTELSVAEMDVDHRDQS